MNINWEEIEVLIDKVENPKGDILFLHGFSGNYNNKIGFRSYFKNYNFYGINLPGHGKSKFKDLSQVDQEYYVDVIVEFINKNNLNNLIILGHSMGGGLAILVYGKIKDKISKLILECPANQAVLTHKELSQKLIPNSIEEMVFINSKLFYNPIKFFGSQEKFLMYSANEFNNISKHYQHLKRMLDPNLMNNFFDQIQKVLPKIKIPTLLITGIHDEIVDYKETVKNFTNNIDKQYLTILTDNDSSHLPLTESKQLLIDVEKFIKG